LEKQLCLQLHAGFLLGLFFGTEDGGDFFFRNDELLLGDNTAISKNTELFSANFLFLAGLKVQIL
jgi:hypothetical protein